MDHDLAGVIKITMICGTFLTAFIAFLTINRRRAPRVDDRALDAVSSRLERIEQAVDAIAIEVERVSEGQRFTSRLLAERSVETPPSALPKRVVTPH